MKLQKPVKIRSRKSLDTAINGLETATLALNALTSHNTRMNSHGPPTS